jgi:hypothetical protein
MVRKSTSSHVGWSGASRASSLGSNLFGARSAVDGLFMGPSATDETGADSEDLRRLSAIVISLQRQALSQGPESVLLRADNANAMSVEVPIAQGLRPSATRNEHPVARSRNRLHFPILVGMLLVALGFGWAIGSYSHWTSAPSQETSEGVNIDAVVEQIIKVESNGPMPRISAPARRVSVSS